MQVKILPIMVCLLVVLGVFAASAADYQDWVPLLPANISGLDKSGSPDGANLEQSGRSWSFMHQDYADDAGNNIRLSVVGGDSAPQMQQFQSMQQLSMETEDRIVKSEEVSGFKAFFEFHKTESKGTLMIAANDQTLVIIEADPVADANKLVSLGDEVPLQDIAATGK
ncbi:MAG: hypothetical protein ACLFRL_07005 [Desulfohalobiaceae bacterium]